MKTKIRRLARIALFILALSTAAGAVVPSRTVSAAPSDSLRHIVVSRSAAEHGAARDAAIQADGKIIQDVPAVNMLVVSTSNTAFRGAMAQNQHVNNVMTDRVRQLVNPKLKEEFFNTSFASKPGQRPRLKLSGPAPSAPSAVTPDPSFNLSGLMWSIERINAPAFWPQSTGDPAVKVAVADTGIDFTHVDIKPNFDAANSKDFQDSACFDITGISDANWAAQFGVPRAMDFNGHGSWIAGNIGGAINNTGVNGIAPTIKLVELKISDWCGAAYDSTILSAFVYAADKGLDIVSISFGGYLDRSDPDQDAFWKLARDVVAYARGKGTVIVASAGNEHVQISLEGRVTSHGSLTTPGDPVADLFGLYEIPGGLPGVVDVSATGNIVNHPSHSCPADALAAGSHAWCKPITDAHQPTGVGLLNQLAYYSNYGHRIDFAAPGGARKFNLPGADRGGCEGWPWCGVDSVYGGSSTVDGYNAWEAFSITSNFALGIPCFNISGPGFDPTQCYTIIQGTSMATPHVSAAFALQASRYPTFRHRPDALIAQMKGSALKLTGNQTTALSASDTTGGDLTGGACAGGYCHLGGPPISDAEAYGAGLIHLR